MKLLVQELHRDPDSESLKSCISTIQGFIDELEIRIKRLEDEVLDKSEQTESEEFINSIPEFATKLSAIVSTEVGEFDRFPSLREFKAFVGVDPKIKQSGYSSTTGRITKRGNPHLRTAFYLAAQVARRRDPQLKAFYEKKISEGKPTRVALVAVARKLCERVFAVVTKGVKYEIRPEERLSFV